MIPGINNLKEIEVITRPSLDYSMELDFMELDGKHVSGTCDGREAVRQAVFCILNTERYQYPVYSWNYGIELQDLYGKPHDYVMSELPRRIREALTQDDRINSVDGFTYEARGKEITVSFTVHTIYGDIKAEKRWSDV